MPNWKKVVVSGSSPDLNNINANSFVKIGGTSAQFLKADGSVDSSTYSTATGVENNADVTPSWVPSVNPNYLTSLSGAVLTSGDQTASGTKTFSGTVKLSNAVNAGFDTNKFLVLDTTDKIDFRTGAEVRADIDAAADGANSDITSLSGLTTALSVAQGGTGANTFQDKGVLIGNITSAVTATSDLTFENKTLFIQGLGTGGTSPLSLSGLQSTTDTSGLVALVQGESSDDILKRSLGSNAFTSTTIPTNNNQLTNGQGFISAFTVQEDGSNVETGTKKLNFTGDGVSTSTDGVDKVTITIPGGGGGGVFSQVGSTTQFSTTSSLFVSASNGAASASLEVHGSGSNIFKVEGSVGTLFSVDDGLDDVIFAANNISGTPVIEANADNTVKLGKLGGFGIVISGSTPAPSDTSANIIITGSIQHNGSYGLGVAASTTIGRFDASNDVVAFSTSDERLKKYIKNIKNPLEKISQINGVSFQWRKTDEEMKQSVHSFEGKDVGVIAQEIEKVLPEVVITRDNGYKAVKYEKIIPLLIESVKKLKAEIEELKKSK